MKNTRIRRYARRLDSPRLYRPAGVPKKEIETNEILLDEFEAMRLCDYEGLSQIEAAEEMQVSRATIQRLLLSGRKKIIESLLEYKNIDILNETNNIKLKGENKMNIEEKAVKRIAFPTSDKVTIDSHFGHTKEFVIYKVEDNEVTNVKYVTPPPHQPGVLPQFLGLEQVDVVITGGMGQMALNLFKRQSIDVILGAKGRIESNLKEYLAGFLTSQGSSCDHKHHKNHGHGDHHHHHN